jgi:hypothetical protein
MLNSVFLYLGIILNGLPVGGPLDSWLIYRSLLLLLKFLCFQDIYSYICKLLPSLRRDISVLARLREGRHWNRDSGKDIFLFSKAWRSAVGPTKSSVQWIRGAVFPGVNRRGLEAGRSWPSSSWLWMSGTVPPLPHLPSCLAERLLFLCRVVLSYR